MNAYRVLEIAILGFAVIASLWMAVHRLMPAQAKQWRRQVLLWMIADTRDARVRGIGLRWARRAQANIQSSSCGGCNGCEPQKKL